MTGVIDSAGTASEQRTAAGEIEPRVRTAIAVIMTRFPRIDETFILREIDELERRGQPVLLVPLLRGNTTVIHEEAKPWMRRALYTPFLSASIVRSNLTLLFREPGRYLRLLGRLVAGTVFRPSTLLRTLALFPKSVHLADVLPRRGIRHVHAHFATHATTMAYIIGSLSNVTYSFSVHGPDVFVHRLLLREKIRKAKFVRAISIFNKAFLCGLYPAESDRKIEVVHSGVNPDVYADAAAARRQSGHPRLLSVAALTPSRGFPFLVDACARLATSGVDVECTIVGAGPLQGATEHWIRKHRLHDSVRLPGALPQHEVARLMGEADVFVLPSIIALDGQMDGIPVSLMEAMAAGRPVIATAISGIPELVRDGVNGIIVDATHPERVAEAVRRLLADPALRERMGRAGQQRVRDAFDIRRTTAALVALFDRHRDVNAAPATIDERVRTLNWSRLGASAVGVRRIDERPDSVIIEVTTTDGSTRRDVIVRQQRENGDEAGSAVDRARHLFETVATLGQSLNVEAPDGIEYGVPKVLMFDEPRAALVIERADGKSLGGIARIAAASGLTGKLVTPLRRAGTWLQVMQQGTRGDEDGRHVLTAVVLLALNDLELAIAAERPLRRRHDAIVDRIKTLESELASRPLHASGHHGDYRPDSIFLGDRSVKVIDFSGFREGLPLEDVANFILHLRLQFSSPLGRARVDALQSAFLSGYLGQDELDRPALQLFMMTRALRMLARGGTASTPLQQWRHRRILRDAVIRGTR